MEALEFRTFSSVEWNPWMVTYNIDFERLPGEKYDCLSQLPHWLHRIMTHKASPLLEGVEKVLPPTEIEYWISRLAVEYTSNPTTDEWFWVFSGNKSSVTDESKKAPSIWYDMSRTEIRAGRRYEDARYMSFREFCSMEEQKAVDWLNGDWKPVGNFITGDGYNTKRRLDLGGTI